MSVSIEKQDLRKTKTRKAFYAALSSLLVSHNFEKITVTDICEESLISRATFYSCFLDKYDMLKHWLVDLCSKNANDNSAYDQIEKVANSCIHNNESVLKNLVYDANIETLDILFNFILFTMDLTIEKNDSREINSKNIVLSNFYAGGMIFYLLWQIKNKFPANVQPMNIDLYEIMNRFQKWKSEEK